MSSSTTRARWSLTGAATTLAPGVGPPGGVVAQDMVQLLRGGGIGPGAAPPGLGPAPSGGNTSTVEGMFRSPTSSRGPARDPATTRSRQHPEPNHYLMPRLTSSRSIGPRF
jgi:hypothetical protein